MASNWRSLQVRGNMIVSLLLSELEAGKKQSSIDMMWINGETFYQLRQIDALYGPFSGDPSQRTIHRLG